MSILMSTISPFPTLPWWFATVCRWHLDRIGRWVVGATRLANNGATARQLNAIYGWADGSQESARYSQKADRKRLVRDGMAKFGENKTGFYGAPVSPVRTGDLKAK
jgi:hypothetical protein